jgi:tetratricopeptide (TPR) repeat protein
MAKTPIIKTDVPDPALLNPKSNDELIERGWLFYSHKDYVKAEIDLLKALDESPDNPDILYALGLSYKASGNNIKALESFDNATKVLDRLEDRVRARMLLRLIHGQINQIKDGNWNLEKEIWHYVR